MAMIQLFNGMQSSLSMVYDREMGNMRTLLVSRCREGIFCSASCSRNRGVAAPGLRLPVDRVVLGYRAAPIGYLTVLPALILSGLMLGALGMLISSGIKQLENFAGVMNLSFFRCSSPRRVYRYGGCRGQPMLYYVCLFNPFTHAVELIRFALYGQTNWISLAVVGGCTAAFMIGAIYAYIHHAA